MRVFIAVEFDKEVKEYLYGMQQIIKAKARRGNFVDKDNFHLTLKFIGEVDKEQVDSLKGAIDSAVINFPQFLLRNGEFGFFPRGNKKIVWMGLEGDLRKLEVLHKKLEVALFVDGFEKDERQYNPHITLGRNVVLEEPFEDIRHSISTTIKEMTVPVSKISLMASRREEGRLVYRVIYVRRMECQEL